MTRSRDEYTRELEERVLFLETKVKHLTNDLRLTRDEYETSLSSYFEIYSNLENKVAERTRELTELQRVLEGKGKELQVMLDSSPAMIFYKDSRQRHIRVNKKYSQTLGVPLEDIHGKTFEEILPGKSNYGLETDLEIIRTGKPVLNKTEFFDTTNGQRQVVIDRIPYKDINGRVMGIIGFALDVTDLKRVEAEKRELETQLMQAQKMESIGILAGGIAHDFNNILAIIMGNSQLIDLELEDGDRLKPAVNHITEATKRATNIVRSLLDYARPQKFKFEPTNLFEHAAFAKKQLQKSDEYDHSRMVIELAGDEECVANADAAKIEQVLFNLGKNALQAIPNDSEGKITYEIKVVDLDEAYTRTRLGLEPGRYVAISVSDNGVGISEENQKRIFEPFFTTKQIGEGTGLGLAQVYSIIKEHEGYIEVESEAERGTTFTVFLKHTGDKIVRKETPEIMDECMSRGEKVLVVEDTDQLMDLVVRMLEKFGYEVVAAASGEEGIAKYEETGPDVVIMDVQMPGMDGVETFNKLRESHPEARVIFSTGHGMDEEYFVDLGAKGAVSKPYDPYSIARKLRSVLDS